LSSPRKTIAGSLPSRRSRFSAKFSFASGKNRAPGILAASTIHGAEPLSPIAPQKSQTALQNASGCSTE